MITITSQQNIKDNDSNLDSKPYLPGDLAMWFFILAELTVFAIFFIAFAVTRQLHPEMFLDGQRYLHPVAGAINTLALITSSYFVASSVLAIKSGKNKQSGRLLLIALFMAVIYIGVKSWEYNQLFNLGFGLSSNTYFTLYFMITAFHFMHVILGMIILAYTANKAFNDDYRGQSLSGFESGTCYWHMVDLVWVILFPLLYVIH